MMMGRHRHRRLFLLALACCADAKTPAQQQQQQQLPSWTAPMPDASLPLGGYERLERDFLANIAYASEDIGLYNHNVMFSYDVSLGGFLIYWKNGILEEDSNGQRVLGAFSGDARNWSAPLEIFPNLTLPGVPAAMEPAPAVQINGRVYAAGSPAFVNYSLGHVAQGSQCALWPDSLDPRNCGPAADYAVQYESTLLMRQIVAPTAQSGEEATAAAAAAAAVAAGGVTLGPLFWASTVGPSLFAAQTAAFGIKTLGEMDAETQADLQGLGPRTLNPPCAAAETGTTKCEWCPGGCQAFTDIPYDDAITNERAFYHSEGLGRDVILYRSQADSFSFYASTRPSFSAGAASGTASGAASGTGARAGAAAAASDWSLPQATNIPNVKSNLDAGLLADGRVFLASNPVLPPAGSTDDSFRDPVTLATSSDGGASFDRAGVALTCLDMPGHGRETTCNCSFAHDENKGVSYPQGLVVVAPAPEHLRGTYVAATNNKEDVWVTKVTPP